MSFKATCLSDQEKLMRKILLFAHYVIQIESTMFLMMHKEKLSERIHIILACRYRVPTQLGLPFTLLDPWMIPLSHVFRSQFTLELPIICVLFPLELVNGSSFFIQYSSVQRCWKEGLVLYKRFQSRACGPYQISANQTWNVIGTFGGRI